LPETSVALAFAEEESSPHATSVEVAIRRRAVLFISDSVEVS